MARQGRAPLLAAALVPLLLLVAQGPAPCAAQQVGQLQAPDYSVYTRKSDLLQQVWGMAAANPKIMRVEQRSAQDEGYKVDMLIATIAPGGLSSSDDNKVRLLLDFGQHGREFISSEVGLQFMRTLTNDTLFNAVVGGGRRAARLRHLLRSCVFKIIPMENTRGRDLVEAGKLCERKNGRGVDTNRNWAVNWGVKEKDYDPSEEYPGRAALSEPESQIIQSVAKAFKPQVWLNVHSGMYALFTPYDHKAEIPPGPDAQAAVRLLQRINEMSCANKCTVGSGGKMVGYLAHGTATDYMYEVLRVPLSFTWEIYGDGSAAFEDCFKMFNPIGRAAYQANVQSWVSAIYSLVDLLPTHPATKPLLEKALADAAAEERQQQQQAAAANASAAPLAVAARAHSRNTEQVPSAADEESYDEGQDGTAAGGGAAAAGSSGSSSSGQRREGSGGGAAAAGDGLARAERLQRAGAMQAVLAATSPDRRRAQLLGASALVVGALAVAGVAQRRSNKRYSLRE